MNPPEWRCDISPEAVDLPRLWSEARQLTAIFFFAYMEQLYKHAPRTYARLRAWRRPYNDHCMNWDYDPRHRFSGEVI